MFSKLFGTSGSDKADRMRQQAIDAFNAIQTPALKDLQVQLDRYVSAGRLTPEQAEAQLLSSNAFNDIATDPSYTGAAKQALQQLQTIGSEGGMTAIDKAQLQDITNQQNQQAKSRNESVMQQARERGMGGSDISTVNQLLNEQSAADRASQQGTQVAANAQLRALQAIQGAGQMGQSIQAQQFGQEAEKAKAANAIDVFNKQTLNQQNLFNTQTANQAQAANLANDQSIANANTQTGNLNKTYNADAVQKQYQDALQKAQGVSGVFNSWANDATAQKARETGADMGITSGLIQTGATALGGAFGGPVGAGVANQTFKPRNPTEDAFNAEYMSKGGEVPGKAPVSGDSPKNDVIDAKLSPGEVVVPRSAMSEDEEFDKFLEKFRPSNRNKAVPNAHIPMEAKALANLHNRIEKLEGGR